jgi:hypothetical protein
MKINNRSFTVLKIKQGHQYYNWCEQACIQSRYLYNTMLYEYRSSYFVNMTLTNTELYHIGKGSEHWDKLPAKCSNQVWMQLTTNISSYWVLLKNIIKILVSSRNHLLPNYNKGMNIVTFEKQALLTNKCLIITLG